MRRYLIFFSLFMLGCKGESVSTNSKATADSTVVKAERSVINAEGLPVIDISGNYPKKNINLEDIAYIEYIQLSSLDDIVITNGAEINVSDNEIILSDSQSNSVIFLDRKGNFVKSIKKQGKGNQEYLNLLGLAVDFNNKELFVRDHLVRNRIMVYSFNGDFIRIIYTPGKVSFTKLRNYNDDYLFAYDDYNLNSKVVEGIELNKQPYMLINKKSGEIKPLPIKLNKRFGSMFKTKRSDGVSVWVDLNIDNYINNGNDNSMIISDFALDTVYTYNNTSLEPLLIRENSDKNNKNTISSVELCTNRYMFMGVTQNNVVEEDLKDVRPNDPSSHPELDIVSRELMYDKQTREIYEVKLISPTGAECNISVCSTTSIPRNYAAFTLSSLKLMKLNREGKLSGELKEIASTLKEDDNPLLLLAKFRE